MKTLQISTKAQKAYEAPQTEVIRISVEHVVLASREGLDALDSGPGWDAED